MIERFKYEPPQTREAASAYIVSFNNVLEFVRKMMRECIEDIPEYQKREKKNHDRAALIRQIEDQIKKIGDPIKCACAKCREDWEKQGFWKKHTSRGTVHCPATNTWCYREISLEAREKIEELLALKERYEDQLQKVPPYDHNTGKFYSHTNKPRHYNPESDLKLHQSMETKLLRINKLAEMGLRSCENEERISAAAAAHFGKTRDHADKIKGGLGQQLDLTKDCPYCGCPLDDAVHADHIYPVSKGGLSTYENMIIICMQCNIRKGDMTLRNS